MIIDSFLNKSLNHRLRAEQEARDKDWVSSGKLVASRLGWPLQWQILKAKGVEPREFDDYTIRVFLRGRQVEDWIVSMIPHVVSTQVPVEYRGAIGKIDAVVDTKEWDNPLGQIPCEVKSVKNAKYKRIERQGADRSHKLQACLYALAIGSPHFAIIYVSAEDYRIRVEIYETEAYRLEVDKIISRFDQQMRMGVVPVFEPDEKWHATRKYNQYEEWADLGESAIAEKLEAIKAKTNAISSK